MYLFEVNIGDNYDKLIYPCPKCHVILVTQSVAIELVGIKPSGFITHNTIDGVCL